MPTSVLRPRVRRTVLLVGACALLFTGPARGQSALPVETLRQRGDRELVREVEAAFVGETPSEVAPIKCMVPHLVELQSRGFDLRALPRAAAADPISYETPEGHFRIEYELDGTNAIDPTDADASGVPDYVEWVGEAMEESWTAEIDVLGFPPIPLRPSTFFYGWTNFNGVTDPGGSNIVINGDFARFYEANPTLVNDDPDGLVRGAIRVTAAHEFKHALQVAGGWGLSESTQWYELDATSLEDLVYDDVNDYYNYLVQSSSPFTAPSTSLLQASYDDATWNLFLAERYGTHTLVEFSAVRGADPQLDGQRSYLRMAENLGLDFQALWREYAVWTFLSGERADTFVGFEEGAEYPTAATFDVPALPAEGLEHTLLPWAQRYYLYDNRDRTVGGGLRVVFDGDHADWSVAVVLQREDATTVVPMTIGAGVDTLETAGVDLADYDAIAVIVGNAREATSVTFDPYTISITPDPTLRTVPLESIGRIKGYFAPPDGQR